MNSCPDVIMYVLYPSIVRLAKAYIYIDSVHAYGVSGRALDELDAFPLSVTLLQKLALQNNLDQLARMVNTFEIERQSAPRLPHTSLEKT